MANAAVVDLDDAALVIRARTDPDAFRVLFHRHVHDVHRFVWRRTRDDALADDLTALTFERCWDALPGFRLRGESARPWLMRIAANAIASHFRSEGRRRRREDTSAAGDARLRVATEPERTVLAEDTELVGALAALGERYQQVLSLRFLAGLTTEEAADAMQVNRKHFAALQYRALAALRRELSRRGMEVTDG